MNDAQRQQHEDWKARSLRLRGVGRSPLQERMAARQTVADWKQRLLEQRRAEQEREKAEAKAKAIRIATLDAMIRDAIERHPVLGVVASIKVIQLVVADHYGVTVTDMLSARRTANLVFPRQVAMYIARTSTLKSLPEIGRRSGGRDHTTVLYAVRRVEARIAADPAFAAEVAQLEAKIRGEG